MSAAAGVVARFGLIALPALALGALLLSSASPAGAQSKTDYDTDGDNLIEVGSLVQLNAVGYDLDGNGVADDAGEQGDYDISYPNALAGMGCAATCLGYELSADLDFNTDTGSDSGGAAVIDADDDYPNWGPIGDDLSASARYNAVFEGNGHTISNMKIRSVEGVAGLFGATGSAAVIRNLAMADVDVDRANEEDINDFGAIAGINRGRIERSSSTGAVKGLRKVGGLAGRNFGTVINSYSTVTVTGAEEVGGLVGYNEGSASAITSSFYAGNLLNPQLHYLQIALGISLRHDVNAIDAGGVAGKNDGTITASYFDEDIGFSSSDSTAQTTVALQTPTGATGIYSTWDANIWDFGTSSEYPSLKPPVVAAVQAKTDYDTDGDNLIEVSTLDQLNAIRWDLDGNGAPDVANANDYALAFPNAATGMGCAATCTGYELAANLNFNTDTSSDSGGAAVIDADDDYYNGGSGWEPLGDSGPKPLMTTFEGNNRTISNLFINRTGNSDNYIGLFGQLGGATVTRVHLVGAKVTGNNDVGALVGHITLGTVSHSSSSGTVSGVVNVGGLVGTINSRSGVVEYSRSSAVVTATGNRAGGLVGNGSGRVRVSYATGAVTGLDDVGGLAGYSPTSFYAVYATGAVTATGVSDAYAGGLVGGSEGGIYASYSTGAVTSASGDAAGMLHGSGSGATVADSYWDVTTTGIADDNNADTGEGKTTSELQSPTQTDGYAGIYANWDIDVDADSNVDDPWDFGTASEYPALKADSDGDGRATAYEFGRQGRSAPGVTVDYDDDNDGLIEVVDLDQLNAIRWDLDGDGAPDVANANDYTAAFPTPATGMGCPITATDVDDNDCTGYELAANLNFNTDTSSDSGGAAVIDADDDYYNGGSGWVPIGDDSSGRNTWYNANFEGNGHTISNLFISRDNRWVGLFGISSEAGFFRNVGLVDVNVTGWGYTGALIGHAYGTVDAAYSTGTVVSNKLTHVGGLVGHLSQNGSIQRSYSTASVTGFGTRLGGLVGTNRGPIRASYATGAVAGSRNSVNHSNLHWRAGGRVRG